MEGIRCFVKIALAQINTRIGDFQATVKKVVSFVHRAKEKKVDLIAFPEMTTTGYPPRDLLERPSFIEKNLQALDLIASSATGIAVVVGYLERNRGGSGKSLFNAAALLEGGQIRGHYFKNLLPSYDVFDETRYFEPGTETGLWSWHQKIGISICEDYWSDERLWQRRLYSKDPLEEQAKSGADFFLNLSCSPYSVGKEKMREELLRAHAVRHRLPLFFVNLVGGNDELVFDGRSLAISAQGEVIASGKAFQEDLVIVDMQNPPNGGEGELEAMEDLESLFHALLLGIRDYAKKCGFKKVALGISGGIDSALTATLAAKALGPKNVLGVVMPSPYTGHESLEDAKKLIKNLGISSQLISINSVYRSYRQLFRRVDKSPDLADENLQARIRGNLLMTLSNRHGYLVLTTGNKSELAVGYCTLYGDMSGGLAALSDLPKQMVYQLSRWINRRQEVIPERIFAKAPTAELRPNQTDQDTLPPYEVLDSILKAYVEEQKSEDEIVALGFPKMTVRWVIRRVDQNEYKRRQAAPGIRVTSKAFGMGRRHPMARKV